MRAGFTFKGQHSNWFGATVKTKDRPIRPETKETIYETQSMNGGYSFAEANANGHEYYRDKVFQMELQIAADELPQLQKKITRLSRWIIGRGELIFDDTPLVKWDARIVNTVQYLPERGGKKAVFLVSYRVKPFAGLIFDTIEGSSLKDEIELDSDMPLDISEYFVFTGGTHAVKNIGDMPVKPIITIKGTAGAVSVTCNGHTLTVPGDCMIDCERYLVTDSSGRNLMNQVTGEFFELAEGETILTITGGSGISVSIEYAPLYIHSVDTQNIGLGE
jgi:phage-related protein